MRTLLRVREYIYKKISTREDWTRLLRSAARALVLGCHHRLVRQTLEETWQVMRVLDSCHQIQVREVLETRGRERIFLIHCIGHA